MSEVVHIPQLRFPEFDGEWDGTKVGKIGTFFSGGTPTSSNKDYYSGTIPFIGSGKISSESVKQHITQEALDSSSAKIVNEGDLLYALYGATSGAVALSKFNGAINQAVLCIRTNENKFFLKTWLEKNKERILGTYLQGGQGNLSAQIVKSLKLNLPTKQEQQKIAAFLTAVDTKIEQLSKKQELLGEYKKGLMQQIFSQAIRFKADDGSEFSEWEEKKLGDVTKITTGNSNREDSGLDGKYKFFDRSEDIRTSDRYLFDGKAVIVAGEGSSFPPKYFEGKFDLHQRTYAIMNFIEADPKYIFYFMDKHKNYLLRYAVGSTVKSLRLPIFQKMPVNLPLLKEQAKIASFLSSIDNKIEQVGKQLNESKQFKKALLQQMFV